LAGLSKHNHAGLPLNQIIGSLRYIIHTETN
jgi:hypothetical protein